jgi:hypothetical protein
LKPSSEIDRESAIRTFYNGATILNGRPIARLKCALKCAKLAEELPRHPKALAAYALAVKLLPIVAGRGTRHATKLYVLRIASGLASNACACALNFGEVKLAVELLEQGRSTVWSMLSQHRDQQLNALEAEYPEYAKTLRNDSMTNAEEVPLRAWLSNGFATNPYYHNVDGFFTLTHTAALAWESTLEKVRKLPGYEHFLETPPFNELAKAAEAGPIVMINIAISRCDCIILLPVQGDPCVLELSNPDLQGFDRKDAIDLSESLAAAISSLRRGGESEQIDKSLRAILLRLWKDIVSPVLTFLKTKGYDDSQRIWWYPTGEVSFLPLHAAKPLKLPPLISSYTTSLPTLLRSRNINVSQTQFRPLIIEQSAPPNEAPIPNCKKRSLAIAGHAQTETSCFTSSIAGRQSDS